MGSRARCGQSIGSVLAAGKHLGQALISSSLSFFISKVEVCLA
jgi:hypothetical protein